MQCIQGLDILLWGCRKTTNDAKKPPWRDMAHSEFIYQRQCELLETAMCIAFDGHVNTTERVAETELGEDEAD